MPICNWCGIESKSDLVCDWCKRPLSLRAMRKSYDPRSAVDLLRDDDESRVSYLPIIAGVIALVAICIGGLLYVQSGSKQVSVAVNEPPPAPPAPVAQEFRVTRSEMPSALTAAAYTPPQRVFLPEVAYVGQSTLERSRSSNEPVFRSEHLQTDLGDSMPTIGINGAAGAVRTKNGKRVAVGKVTIVNRTNNTVIDFRVLFEIDGKQYTGTPFEGDPAKPQRLTNRSIRAKRKLTTPVLIQDYAPKKDGLLHATVTVEAQLDGDGGTMEAETKI